MTTQQPTTSTTSLTTDAKRQLSTLEGYLLERKEVLARVAGDVLDPARLVRLALGNATRTPKLLQCSPRSWVCALMDAAFYGLEPNPILGHAYLVPYMNKKARPPELEVQLIVGYKGQILLACESKAVDDVDADIVYAREFEQKRFVEHRERNPPFEHQPLYENRGAPFGAYAVGWRITGGQRVCVKFKFLPKIDIDAYRARSRAADSGPWVTDTLAMWKKTAVRRMASFLPFKPGSKIGLSIAQEAAVERTGEAVPLHVFDERRGAVEARTEELVADDPPDGVVEGEDWGPK
jgi:recombination protein RecT